MTNRKAHGITCSQKWKMKYKVCSCTCCVSYLQQPTASNKNDDAIHIGSTICGVSCCIFRGNVPYTRPGWIRRLAASSSSTSPKPIPRCSPSSSMSRVTITWTDNLNTSCSPMPTHVFRSSLVGVVKAISSATGS